MSENELPEGWAETSLGEVSEVALGKMLDQGKRKKGNFLPYLRNANVRWGQFDLGNLLEMPFENHELERYGLGPGDLLVCEGGEPGRCAVWRESESPIRYQKAILRVRPRAGILPEWFGLSLQHDATSGVLEQYFTGSTIKHLPRQSLLKYVVYIAPLPEQRRIVDKVEALLAEVNRTKGRLERVRAILKRFRQSVLAAACSGKLTEEWRGSQPNLVGAEAALGAIARFRAKNGLSSATRPIDDEGFELPDSELPEGWSWCRVGQVADVRLGGTPSRKEPSYWNGTIPWVSSGEVANCRISSTAERITERGLDASNAKMYPVGTVLIAMIGEGKTRAQAAILDIEACTNQNAAGLVFDAGNVSPAYIWYWALGEYDKNRSAGRGGNQPALNGAKVRALPLPLPPLDEQMEIVRRVQRIFVLADALEERVGRAAVAAESLPQGILSKAFSGELVPTEAELARAEGRAYEPASVLLERIGKQGAGPEAPKRGRKAKGGRK